MRKLHESTVYRPDWEWLGRSLSNYKSMHAAGARSKGVYERLMEAKTLTQARKVVFGYKKGQTK
jgi:hypothetical protein